VRGRPSGEDDRVAAWFDASEHLAHAGCAIDVGAETWRRNLAQKLGIETWHSAQAGLDFVLMISAHDHCFNLAAPNGARSSALALLVLRLLP
jgi:hypothetical protein